MIEVVSSSEVPGSPPAQGTYTLASDVVLLLAPDHTGRLLDLGGDFFALSLTAAEMLHSVLKFGIPQTLQDLSARYPGDRRRLEADLGRFLTELEEKGLIRPLDPTVVVRRGGGQGWRIAVSGLTAVAQLFARSRNARARCLLILARISFKRLGWSRTIAAWKKLHPLGSTCDQASNAESTARAVDQTVRSVAAQLLLPVGCKERALCSWALLRAAGIPAALVLGVSLYPLSSHAWCRFGGLTLSDYEERCAEYQEIARYE